MAKVALNCPDCPRLASNLVILLPQPPERLGLGMPGREALGGRSAVSGVLTPALLSPAALLSVLKGVLKEAEVGGSQVHTQPRHQGDLLNSSQNLKKRNKTNTKGRGCSECEGLRFSPVLRKILRTSHNKSANPAIALFLLSFFQGCWGSHPGSGSCKVRSPR